MLHSLTCRACSASVAARVAIKEDDWYASARFVRTTSVNPETGRVRWMTVVESRVYCPACLAAIIEFDRTGYVYSDNGGSNGGGGNRQVVLEASPVFDYMIPVEGIPPADKDEKEPIKARHPCPKRHNHRQGRPGDLCRCRCTWCRPKQEAEVDP